jgi:hypothetical protein
MIFLPPIFRIFFLILITVFLLAITGGVRAFESSSAKFQIYSSSIESISGTATSNTFQNRSAGGQNATGYSTSTSLAKRIYSGILYWLFDTPTPSSPPSPPPSGGGGGSPLYQPPAGLSAEEKARSLRIADFNGDGRVDIIDLSILLYYFGRRVGGAEERYDLSRGGVVDIVDVSIFLYYLD